MNFGEILKEGRERLGLTQLQASEKLGISPQYLSDHECGRITKPKMDFLRNTSILYGIPYDDLCFLSERIPRDIFDKIIKYRELYSVVRKWRK